MSRLALHHPISIANRLFLAFLFGMVVVIGCLILFKKTPLQAHQSPIAPQVVLHVSHDSTSLSAEGMPPTQTAPSVTH